MKAFAVLLLVAAFAAGPALVAQENVEGLFTLDTYELALNGVSYTFERDSVSLEVGSESAVWRGRVEGAEFPSVFTMRGGMIAGTLVTPDGLYRLRPDEGALSVTRVRRQEALSLAHDALRIDGSGFSPKVAGVPDIRRPGLSYIVSTMELYAPESRELSTGQVLSHEEMNLLIENQVDWTNSIFLEGGIDLQLWLVYVGEASWLVGSGSGEENLMILSTDPEVARLRDEHGADLVGGWFAKGGGVAYRPSVDFSDDTPAFHVAKSSSLVSDFVTYPHEVGHNFNMGHDLLQEPIVGGEVYPFAHAHFWFDQEGGCYNTFMSSIGCRSASANGYEMVELPSSPDVFYKGMPTGVEGEADNVRMANIAAPYVADYRKGGPFAVCSETDTNLCLTEGRFHVSAHWKDQVGNEGDAFAEPITADTGYFWFFNPDNIEAVIKVVDGRPINGNFWVFAGGLTNVEVTLRVLDTETGDERVYTNPLNIKFAPIQDTEAFAGTPTTTARYYPEPERKLERKSTFHNNRFLVDVAWHDGENGGFATGVPLTDEAGYFWFFNEDNVEVVVKILDGGLVNGHFWVFATGLTNVQAIIDITDFETGNRKQYINYLGEVFQPIQDVMALPAGEEGKLSHSPEATLTIGEPGYSHPNLSPPEGHQYFSAYLDDDGAGPAPAEDYTVSVFWQSSDPSVARYQGSGWTVADFQCVGSGAVTVTASLDGLRDTTEMSCP